MIPVNRPLLDGNEAKYLAECILSGWVSSDGPFVERFEQAVAERCQRKYAIAVSSGTAALDCVIDALELGEGDEVICPTFTIISSVAQLIRSGARLVLVDSDPVTWNMDVDEALSKVTASTRAIMAVHTYGLPVDIKRLIATGVPVIEDAAQALGLMYEGKPCGSFGKVSILSFYANKIVTCGEGGMILTDDRKLAETCRSLRNLCFGKGAKRFEHERLGWNLRMSNLQAAVGLAQLEQLDAHLERKHVMGGCYQQLLADIPQLRLPYHLGNDYWVFGMLSRYHAPGVIRDLEKLGVQARPFFCPMHQQPFIFKAGEYPIADDLYWKGFYVPSGSGLTASEQEDVSKALHKVLM